MYCWGSYVTRTVASSTCTLTSSKSNTPLLILSTFPIFSIFSSILPILSYLSTFFSTLPSLYPVLPSLLPFLLSVFPFFLIFPSFFPLFCTSLSVPVKILSLTHSSLPSTYLTFIQFFHLSATVLPLILSFSLSLCVTSYVSRTMHDANALINSLMKLAVLEIQSQLEVTTHTLTFVHVHACADTSQVDLLCIF